MTMSGYKRAFPCEPGRVCEVVEQEHSAKRIFLSSQVSRADESISTCGSYSVGCAHGEQPPSAHIVSRGTIGDLCHSESANVLTVSSSQPTPASALSSSSDEPSTLASSVSGGSSDGQIFCLGMVGCSTNI